MDAVALIRAMLQDAPVGVIVTDAVVELPGPTIVYANPAFGRLVGRDPDEIRGLTPRFMQGRETRRSTLDLFHKALAAGERFHGYVTNYRSDGTRYRAEIDCRALRNGRGEVEHFLSFEREVVRRIGRPAPGSAGRYEPVDVSNDLLTVAVRNLGAFEH